MLSEYIPNISNPFTNLPSFSDATAGLAEGASSILSSPNTPYIAIIAGSIGFGALVSRLMYNTQLQENQAVDMDTVRIIGVCSTVSSALAGFAIKEIVENFSDSYVFLGATAISAASMLALAYIDDVLDDRLPLEGAMFAGTGVVIGSTLFGAMTHGIVEGAKAGVGV